MKKNLTDLIDFKRINVLLEGFNKTTGFVTAILDLEGNVLSRSGWRKICTEFHRVNPKTSKKCTISDTELANKLAAGKKYHFYKCLNGLIDVAVPVVIKGEHIANLFSGQFFFEEPDRDFFIKQAEEYGFEKGSYLKALDEVPVIPEKHVKPALDFLLDMTELIAEMSIQGLEQTELNSALKESEEKFKLAFLTSPDSVNINRLEDGMYIDINESFTEITGYTRKETVGKTSGEINIWANSEDRLRLVSGLKKSGKVKNLEAKFKLKDGRIIDGLMSAAVISINNIPHILSITRDITEYKTAEKALRESEIKYRSFFDNSMDAILLTGPDGKIYSANPAACNMFGYSEKEIIQMGREGLIDPSDPRIPILLSQRAAKGKVGGELTMLRKDKTPFEVELSSAIFINTKNQQLTSMIIRDITERKKAEKNLTESEKRYRTLFENLTSGFVLFELVSDDKGIPIDHTIVAANKGFEATTGIKLQDAIGKRLTQALPGIENDAAEWIERYAKVAVTGESKQFEQGSELLGYYYTITAYQSGLNRCAVIFDDITERKKLEKVLAESEERFRKIFEEGTIGMAMADLTTGIPFKVNQAFCNMLGYKEEELYQLSFLDFTYPEDRGHDKKAVKKLSEGSIQQYKTEKRYQKKNGEVIWGALKLSKIYSEKEQSYYFLAMIEDITVRKMAEKEVKKLNEELEQKVSERTNELSRSQEALLNLVEDLNEKSAEIEKSSKILEAKNKELETFTYSVSHDLKAPLRGIDGYSQILLKEYESKLDSEGQRFLHTIRESALQMNELINDLLEYSRLERKTMNPSTVRIKHLIETLITHHLTTQNISEFSIKTNIPEVEIYTDKDGLTLTLRNLIENAFKFTQKSKNPEIKIGYKAVDAKHLIFVKDNGIGFDMKFHDRIFQIFQRLQRSEDYEGTGIGLAMVSKAVERLNGRVWAESKLGKGTTFYIELPKLTNDEKNI